jgi:mannose-6-phosphate isomerase-like protein (cupin superfamily)
MNSAFDEDGLSMTQVDKPWGWYKTIYSQQGFKINHICVFPKNRLALHSHVQRSEHWVVVKGNSMVRVGNDEVFLHANQNIFIPTRVLHRIENIGDENLFGVNSATIPGISVGSRNKIAAGMILDKNVEDDSIIFHRFKEKVIAIPK